MPIYDYRCPGCWDRFEQQHPIQADPLVLCPHCGERSYRLVSAPMLRGSAHIDPQRNDLPTNLSELGGGRETLHRWRALEAQVSDAELKHPELVARRRQVVSHEGKRPVYADSASPNVLHPTVGVPT